MTKSKVALITAMLLGVVGCQSTPSSTEGTNSGTNKDSAQTELRTFDSIDSIYQTWSTKLIDVDALEIYAPENYGELVDAWKDAQEIFADMVSKPELISKGYSIFSSQTYAQAFDERVALVEQNYDAIMTLKKKSDAILAVAIDQVAYLDDLEANALFPSSYKRLYSQYRGLFNLVLLDELESVQEEQVSFLTKARVLEVKVVRHKFVEPLLAQYELLVDEDFDEVAPLTLARAKSQIELTENRIEANPRAITVIKEAVAQAEFELDHVRSVAQEVKLIASVEDEQFEQVVLDMENRLLAISRAVNGRDYRNLALSQQSDNIVSNIEDIQSADKTDALNSDLEELRAKLAVLEDRNKQYVSQLADAKKQSEMLSDQVTRSDAHIQSLETLVDSLKNLDKKVASEAEPSSALPVEEVKLSPETEGVELTPVVEGEGA
ncbi:ATPase [Vibrio sp. T187]|uniref:ATPase n=1 Tax=Vibrio TaxID=662 RepID=UPI0010C9DB78|nr:MULTISPECIES: ATPase [Vibrio]MBW3694665.1 ATPase [Vibrio sp. T187]